MEKEMLISSLTDAGICNESEIKGATIDEIEGLETAFGKKLPLQYKEFLLGVGKGAGKFFQGTDIFYSALEGLKNEAVELLRENEEDSDLPKDAFVFSMHQGYEFTYFNVSDGDDPPVYQFVEGNGPPVVAWNTFSDFVKDSITQHSRMSSSL